MTTPLAYLRGFQLASGVGLRPGPLQEAVLSNFFRRDRLSKLYEARMIAAAVLGDKKAASESLTEISEVLFPEMEQKRQDFRKTALRQMEGWRNKVIEITAQKGALSAVSKDIRDVAADIEALSREKLAGKKRRK